MSDCCMGLGWTSTCLSLSPSYLCSHLRGTSTSPEASLQQELWDMAPFFNIMKNKRASFLVTLDKLEVEGWSSYHCRWL